MDRQLVTLYAALSAMWLVSASIYGVDAVLLLVEIEPSYGFQ